MNLILHEKKYEIYFSRLCICTTICSDFIFIYFRRNLSWYVFQFMSVKSHTASEKVITIYYVITYIQVIFSRIQYYY